MKVNGAKFTGDKAMKHWSDEAGLEYMPGKLGMVRPDGGAVGQGTEKLDERVKAYLDKHWMETVGNEFGLKSYQELYAKWLEERKTKSKSDQWSISVSLGGVDVGNTGDWWITYTTDLPMNNNGKR